MHHERIISRKNLWPIFNFIAVTMVLLWGTLGYFEVEAATIFFADDIGDINAICTSRLNSEPKYYKISYYNKSQGVVKVYCIASGDTNSLELTLNKQKNDKSWNIVTTTDLNKDKTLYWPVYK